MQSDFLKPEKKVQKFQRRKALPKRVLPKGVHQKEAGQKSLYPGVNLLGQGVNLLGQGVNPPGQNRRVQEEKAVPGAREGRNLGDRFQNFHQHFFVVG